MYTGFAGQAVENVVNERVHDAHRPVGDPRVRVDLLQDLEDVQRPRPDCPLLSLLGALDSGSLGCLRSFTLAASLPRFRRHCVSSLTEPIQDEVTA